MHGILSALYRVYISMRWLSFCFGNIYISAVRERYHDRPNEKRTNGRRKSKKTWQGDRGQYRSENRDMGMAYALCTVPYADSLGVGASDTQPCDRSSQGLVGGRGECDIWLLGWL